jgi:hypothetical protein
MPGVSDFFEICVVKNLWYVVDRRKKMWPLLLLVMVTSLAIVKVGKKIRYYSTIQ